MLYYGCKGPVLTLGRGVSVKTLMSSRPCSMTLITSNSGRPLFSAGGAAVAAATVVSKEAPVDARGPRAHWIQGGGTVESGPSAGQQLSNGVEHKAAHPEHKLLSPLDDAGNLLHLIPGHVDPPEDSKRALSSCSQGPLILCIGHSMVWSLKNMHLARMAQAKW